MYLWRAYTGALQSHPLRTNVVSAGCIGLCGDAIAQRIESKDTAKQWWDARRAAASPFGARLAMESQVRCGSAGSPYASRFTCRSPMGRPLCTFLRSAVFSLCTKSTYAPGSNTVFYAYKEAVFGELSSWAERYERRMRNEFLQTTAFSLMFWIPAQSINPLRSSLSIFGQSTPIVSCAWNAHLSYSAHKRYAAAEGVHATAQ